MMQIRSEAGGLWRMRLTKWSGRPPVSCWWILIGKSLSVERRAWSDVRCLRLRRWCTVEGTPRDWWYSSTAGAGV